MSLCPTGKRPFDTRRQTKTFLKTTEMHRNRAYRCDKCGYWHHTSASRRVTEWYREHK